MLSHNHADLPRIVTPRDRAMQIVKQIADRHMISVGMILDRGKREHVCRARYEVIVALRDNLGWSFPKIGSMLGRCHTTIHTLYYGGGKEWAKQRLNLRARKYDYDAILDLWAAGKTSYEIRDILGIERQETVGKIISDCRAKGDPRAVSREAVRRRVHDYDAILNLWAKGYSRHEIQVMLGLPSHRTAKDIACRARSQGDPRAISHKPSALLRMLQAKGFA